MLTMRTQEFTISMNKINSFLIPNVNGLSSENQKIDSSNNLKKGEKSEFQGLIEKQLGSDLNVSTHAAKRLQERNIEMDGNEYLKIKEAINKLRAKGSHDSLVITDKAAYVVDVDKNTVVTAVDKNRMSENVFTKIDSTIFM